jgi:hypothetical protein
LVAELASGLEVVVTAGLLVVVEGSMQLFGLAIKPESKPTTKIIIKPIDINAMNEAFENSTPRVIFTISYLDIQLIQLFKRMNLFIFY